MLEADSGSIETDRSQIGTIIEAPGFLKFYSAEKNLRYLASLNGRQKDIDYASVLKMVGLSDVGKKRVGKFSMGMRQRLGIAQAIMEDQSILILDEPMNGLDNRGVEEMRSLFLSLRSQGKTILIASHNREDIEVLCDEVYEMDRGVLRSVSKGA